jgi:hypothetical protein
MRLLAVSLAGLSIVSTFTCGCGAICYPNYYELSTSAPIARGIMTGTIEHLEEVDRGKSVSIDVRVSAGLIDFQTGEILWRGSASGDAVVEQRSVSGVVSQLSLGRPTFPAKLSPISSNRP